MTSFLCTSPSSAAFITISGIGPSSIPQPMFTYASQQIALKNPPVKQQNTGGAIEKFGGSRAVSHLAVYDEHMRQLSGFGRGDLKRKRCRFDPMTEKQYLPPPFVDLPVGLSVADVDQFFREQRLDDITEKLKSNQIETGDPDIRPPSPPPVYDKNGNRTNSRDQRCKQTMQKEYHRLVSSMIKRLDGYIAPTDYRAPKIIRRIEIPSDRFPDVNFLGMLIGPRGINHKRLEDETGCTIAVRGRGRGEGQSEEEQQMPVHVYICSEDEERVSAAVRLVEPLLDPTHPDHEREKLRGMEQLEIMNGTTTRSAERQLRLIEADGRDETDYSMVAAGIQCGICGGKGHLTADCPMRNPTAGESREQWRADNEYANLMKDVGGEVLAEGKPTTSTHPLAINRK
jgi:splicing factor 1